MSAQVEIFESGNKSELQQLVNQFLKHHRLIDIKYDVACFKIDAARYQETTMHTEFLFTALVIYHN